MEKRRKLEKGGNIAKEGRRETKNVELLELFLNLSGSKNSFKQEKAYVLYHRCGTSDTVIFNFGCTLKLQGLFKMLTPRISFQMF